jgi:hypothetical protein
MENSKNITGKINDTKFNRLLKMKKLSYNNNIDEKIILKDLNICQKTLKEWKRKMQMTNRLEKVTIDRALKEMIFTQKSQIECFEFLKKDLNYFATFEEVRKNVDITRYLYRVVKKYIREEITTEK